MSTPNKEYWTQRFTQLTEALLNKGEAYAVTLDTEYRKAFASIQKDIEIFFRRFAANNEISLSEAKKMLNSKELEEFKWTVEEYIAYGKQNALDGAWMKQLENASLRYRISRLESLQIQMRQQIEALSSSRVVGTRALLGDAYSESYYRSIFEVQKGFGVGSTFAQLNTQTIDSVLSSPWAADGTDFSGRIWSDRSTLVVQLQTKLAQAFIRGDAPDKVIKTMAVQFNAAKAASGRLVMTESAHFANEGRAASYTELEVEQYEYVATLEKSTCEICGDLDGMVFQLKDKMTGANYPVMHPWCRCTTVPYFEDNYTERFARGPDGKTYKVPGDMTYKQWREQLNEEYGKDAVDSALKAKKNTASDKQQYKKYKSTLKGSAPKSFANFQDLKYNNKNEYSALKQGYEQKQQADWQTKVLAENSNISDFKVFNSADEIPQWAKDQATHWTQEEKEGLNYYTSHEFTSINRYLRGKTTAGAFIQDKIGHISSAIEKADIADNIVVWRGAQLGNFTQGEWLAANPIDTWADRFIDDKAFSSTSMLRGSAFDKSVFMQILVPKGSKGAYISALSDFSSEYEMLFQKGSVYQILTAEENSGKTFIKVLYQGVDEE